MRRFYGQAQNFGIQGRDFGGTGQQNVFEVGSLKNPVIGCMQHEIGRMEIARDSQARTHRILVDQQLIVVPAKTGADGPFAKADEILHESGLLEVRAISGEVIGGRRAGIELREVRDHIAELLAKKRGIRLDARFPLLIAVMDRNRAFEIALTKTVVLEGNDGRRKRVRVRVVPSRPAPFRGNRRQCSEKTICW